MLVTIQCIAIVLISIVFVGIPCSWLLNGRKWRGELAWLEMPFLGIAAIILILQNLVYLDLRVGYTAPLIWAGGLAGWLWMYRSGQLKDVFRTLPRAVFGVALAVYLLQGLGLLIVGAKFYVGRAWSDQFNYTAIAQFLSDERFNTPMSEVGNRPYLATAISLKMDRIGQSVLHSFFATSSLQNAKSLFEPTILLSVSLLVLAMYSLGRRFNLQKRYALGAGAVASLLPGITIVHLESFLSHALAIPLLLFFPVLLDDLIKQLGWRRLSICAVIAAAIVSIYTEFWIVLIGLTTLMLGIAALGAPRAWRLLGCWAALTLAPFILNPLFASTVLSIFSRIGASLLPHIYPWALSIEGVGRLWLGDLAAAPGVPQILIRTYALAATMLGYYGLMHMCVQQLSIGYAAGAELDKWRVLAFALGVLSLALLPLGVLARDSQHPYQFYKLLLSISPLLVLGIALAFQPYLFAAAGSSAATQVRQVALPRELPALLVMAIMLAGSIVGTTVMVLRSTSLQPAARSHGYLLITPAMQQLQERLEELHDSNIFYYEVDTTWSTSMVNAWLAYFARHNQIWLGNPRFIDIDLATIPETRSIVDLKTIPSDVLILSRTNKPVIASTQKQTLLWSNSDYQLWKLDTSVGIVPLRLENQNGLETVDGERFFWIGQGDTILEVLTSTGGVLHLVGAFLPGPSVTDRTGRKLLVMTDAGYQSQLTLLGGNRSISLPVPAGATKITLRPLDKPTKTVLPNGDTRPLILGVKGLTVRLDP
jgi:hypothetical protein